MMNEFEIILPESDEKLLAECHISAYRSSGSGGQHVNKTDSAVRLTHTPTGIVVTCQKERSQHLNKQHCITKLRKVVEKLNYRPPERIATRLPRSVKRENLATKAKHSQKKRSRAAPSIDDP